jgi:eukaryotic-like serine/threonine-protein kinase
MTEPTALPRARIGAIDPIIKAFEAAWDAGAPASVGSFLPPPDDPLYAKAVLELVRVDLEFGWEHGRPRTVGDYRAAYPDVFGDPLALRAVAFEEYRQRREHGEDPDPGDYARQYDIDTADWPPRRERGSVGGTVVVDTAAGLAAASLIYRQCRDRSGDLDRAVAPAGAGDGLDLLRAVHDSNPAAAGKLADATLAMPEVGQQFVGFYLEAELGRGAFGRVFLARDLDLANRQVALKVTADLSGEEQTLAQLQHTNIVPLYDRKRSGSLQAVVMPYAGGTTLADVILSLRDSKSLPASGRHLISTINDRKLSTIKARSDLASGGASSARVGSDGSYGPHRSHVTHPNAPSGSPDTIPHTLLAQFEGQSYVEAVLWLGSRLAGGLAYAHDRGVVHRDLKPANVLLRDDGEPMLLDFNLADDAHLRNRAAAARMGGTLPYMSPEQLATFRGGRTSDVDGRTDVYSLGLILFELLTGRPPFANRSGPLKEVVPAMLADRRQSPPRLIRHNPAVSPAVEAIVRKCLAPDPGRRYTSARALQEDVDRQLQHRPLRHVPEPSTRERLRKWRRRHPRLTSATTVGIVAAVVLAVSVGTAATLWRGEKVRRERLTAEKSRNQLAVARNMQLALLNPVMNSTARPDLRRAADLSRDALAAYGLPADRNWLAGPLVAPLPEAEKEQLADWVAGMQLAWAEAERKWSAAAEGTPRDEGLALAARLTDQATARLGPDSPAVVAARLGYGDRRGLLRSTAGLKPRTAEDNFVVGRALAREHEFKQAIPYLIEATRQDPKHYWALNNLGGCYFDLGNMREALACYGACLGMAPDGATAYFAHYQRAIVYRFLRAYNPAKADVEQAIEYLPSVPDDLRDRERAKAHLLLARILTDRAKMRSSRDDYDAAEKVLTDALAFGDGQMQLYLQRSEVRRLRGDKAGSRADWEAMLKLEPADEIEWTNRGLARLETDQPEAALRDFDRALAINPTFQRALQNKANTLSESLNRPAEAVAVSNRVIELYPDYTPARIGRGVLLARQGKRTEAHADAAAALGRDQRPMTLYQAANVYALTAKQVPADAERVLPLLAAAVWNDEALAEVDGDADMNAVRDRAWFKQVVAVVRAIKSEAAK